MRQQLMNSDLGIQEMYNLHPFGESPFYKSSLPYYPDDDAPLHRPR